MHRFSYRNGELWCEDARVAEIAKKVGTPLYLYSVNTMLDHLRKLQAAFSPVRALVCYAVKANANLAICRALAKSGAGFDVVSGGELRRVLQAGGNPGKIVYASVGKTVREIEDAIRARILLFNVESEQELEQLDRAASRLGRRPKVSLRLNPEVDPHTHSFITTGHRASKFGIERKTVGSLFRRWKEFPHLNLAGLHIHIGSQILEPRPFVAAVRRALEVVRTARRSGATLEYLNIGGGLGIVYRDEKPQTAADYAKAVLPLLKRSRLKTILEPGRFIVGNSGILVTRVLYLKQSHTRQFAIVDAGMNDLIRPSLYGAYHTIQPVAPRKGRETARYDVVGPVCESGDFFAKNRRLPVLQSGDLLAIMGAGAYGFVMSSNYNARPRPAEVLVHHGKYHTIRRRETYHDLVRGERIPSFLR